MPDNREVDKNIRSYEKRIEESAESMEYNDFNKLGDLYLKKYDVTRAVEYYDLAVDSAIREGLLNNAIALCKKILRNSPERIDVYKRLAYIFAKKGFVSDAVQSLGLYTDEKLKKGDVETVVKTFREIAPLTQDSITVHKRLVEILESQGKLPEAIEEMKIVAGKHRKMGKDDEAMVIERKIFELDPMALEADSQSEGVALTTPPVAEELTNEKKLVEKRVEKIDKEEPLGQFEEDKSNSIFQQTHWEEEEEQTVQEDDIHEFETVGNENARSFSSERDGLIQSDVVDLSRELDGTLEKSEPASLFESEDSFFDEPSSDEVSFAEFGDQEIGVGEKELDGSILSDDDTGTVPDGGFPSSEENEDEIKFEETDMISAGFEMVKEQIESLPSVEEIFQDTSSEVGKQPEPGRPDADPQYFDLSQLISEEKEVREPQIILDSRLFPENGELSVQEVLQHFKAGIKETLDVEDYRSHYDLGIAYKEMGLLEDAVEEFQIVTRDDSGLAAKAFEMLGSCFQEMGKYSIAINTLRSGLEQIDKTARDSIGLYYRLGFALEAIGRIHEAISCYEHVYAMDIHFEDVSDRLNNISNDLSLVS